jgi:addiction module HigA family antidote
MSVRSRLAVHPGEIIKHEFLEPLGMTARGLASELGIPPNRVTEIIAGRRSVTADTAIRLARYWGTTVDLWLNLQSKHDVAMAERLHDYSKIKRRDAA